MGFKQNIRFFRFFECACQRLILFFALFGVLKAGAQDHFYENITPQNGLPTETIYDVFRDSKGFLWFATDMGLIRYNGIAFQTFKTHDSFALSGTYITEDQKGRVWYITFDGFIRYYERGVLKRFSYKSDGFRPFYVINDYVYMISSEGLIKIHVDSGQKTVLQKGTGFQVFMKMDNGFIFGNEKLQTLELPHENTQDFVVLNENLISALFASSSQYMVIIDKNKTSLPTWIISKNGAVLKRNLNIKSAVQNIKIIADEVWIFTSTGIYRFDSQLRPLENFKILTEKNLSSLSFDANQSMWFGSTLHGIYFLKDLNSFQYTDSEEEYSVISQKNGSLFVGTNSGKIFAFDQKLKKTHYITSDDSNQVLFIDFSSSADYNFFTTNGFNVQHHRTKKLHKSFTSVKDLAFQKKVYVAATGFAAFFDTAEKLDYQNLPDSSFIMKNIRAKSIAFDSLSQKTYIASNRGFHVRYKHQLKRITRKGNDIYFRKIRFQSDSLVGIDYEGKIWLLQENVLKCIHKQQKFIDVKVIENAFYFRTQNAIYTTKNGALKKIAELTAFHKIKDFEILDNHAYVITKNKIIKLPTDLQIKNVEKPKLFVNEITATNTKIVDLTEPVKLPYDTNNISIHFDLLLHSDNRDYQVLYYINQKKYELNANQNQLILSNLAHGNYEITFEIKDQHESQTVFRSSPIFIQITPPFWFKLWFWILCAMTLSGTFFLYYTKKMRRIEDKNKLAVEKLQLENKLKESKLQLIKSQMNPHFFFNAINNIQSYIFTKETQEASVYLSKFSKLTRKILEQTDVNEVTIREEIETLRLYLELQKMRFKDLHFEIVNYNPELEQAKIPTMLIQPYVENAILHGLAHSSKSKELKIYIKKTSAEDIQISVIDNGIGREKSEKLNQKQLHKPKSFATKANLERIILLNHEYNKMEVNYIDLTDENGESLGTEVNIIIKRYEKENSNHH